MIRYDHWEQFSLFDEAVTKWTGITGYNGESAKIKTLAKMNLFCLSYHGDRDTSSFFFPVEPPL